MANFDYFVRFRGYDQISQTINKVKLNLDKAKKSANGFARSLKSSNMKGFTNRLDDTSAKLKAQSGQLMQTGASFLALGYAITRPIKAAMEFESSFTDVQKVVGGTNIQLEAMKKQIIGLSKEVPKSATEIAQMFATGGQMGVARENLEGFTKLVSKMSIAFDETDVSKMANSIAIISNRLGVPIDKMETLGDYMNSLADTFSTKGKHMVDILGRTAGLMKSVKIDPKSAVGIASVMDMMASTPEGAAVAAEHLKIMLNRIGKDQTLSNMVKDKGMGGFKNILLMLKKETGTKRQDLITKFFGSNVVGTVNTLIGSLDKYDKVMEKLKDESKLAGSMQKEYNIKLNTTKEQFKLLSNSVNTVMIALGDLFLPIIKNIIKTTKPFIDNMVIWINENKTLVKQIMYVLGALVTLTGAVLILKLTVLPLAYGISFLSSVLGVYTKIASINLITVKAQIIKYTILAFKIALIVGAILLVIYVIKNWGKIIDWVKGIFTKFWNRLGEQFPALHKSLEAFGLFFKDMFLGLVNIIKWTFGGIWDIISWVAEKIMWVFEKIGNIFSWVGDKIAQFFNYLKDEFPWIQKMIEGVKSIGNTISNIGSKIGKVFGFGDKEIKVGVNTNQLEAQKKILDKTFANKSTQVDVFGNIVKQKTPEIIKPEAIVTSKSFVDANINLSAKGLNVDNIMTKSYGNGLNLGFNTLGDN